MAHCRDCFGNSIKFERIFRQKFLVFEAIGRLVKRTNKPKEDFVMKLTSPVSTKTIPNVPKSSRNAVVVATRTSSLSAPPRAQGFFRRAQPTTFHRCLAVHMHFAKHASALD